MRAWRRLARSALQWRLSRDLVNHRIRFRQVRIFPGDSNPLTAFSPKIARSTAREKRDDLSKKNFEKLCAGMGVGLLDKFPRVRRMTTCRTTGAFHLIPESNVKHIRYHVPGQIKWQVTVKQARLACKGFSERPGTGFSANGIEATDRLGKTLYLSNCRYPDPMANGWAKQPNESCVRCGNLLLPQRWRTG